MILCDVNVLLYALIEQSEHHKRCLRLLEDLRRGGQRFGVSELVLAAVIRIATNPKVFKPVPEPVLVFAFVDALRDHPMAVRIEPGKRHWRLFRDLILSTGIRGSETTDAYFAALAIEHGCEWWTADADFSRFPGLNWRHIIRDL
ncbi:MAG: type II toxin-antitoxin system VapC family toxin [Deltaproteobacteria bacterium]|nr:type II toxin-antitoxin system VapC family toxin [Deltaproteobacteria bacterium]